ncbi:hypothetical protein HN51_001910, partial [Arachis hypogaea]
QYCCISGLATPNIAATGWPSSSALPPSYPLDFRFDFLSFYGKKSMQMLRFTCVYERFDSLFVHALNLQMLTYLKKEGPDTVHKVKK